MLRTLAARHDRYPLKVPFRISRGVKTVADVVTVTIHEGDVAGRGEAVPYARYGETLETALTAIERIGPAIEAGAARARLAALLPAGAARNAVDCALWDLEARLAGTSVADMMGVPPPGPIASAITIGLDRPDAMHAAAAGHAAVPLLKVKVDRVDAESQIRAVRDGAPKPRLIVDPNESWSVDDILRLAPVLLACRIDLLEQPVPAGEDEALRDIACPIPVCADESVHVAADLDRLVGCYTHVNVKLDKAGGLTGALDLVEAARSRGFGIMVGCMVASSLGIAPALQLAAAADFVDLDGPLWLAADLPGGVADSAGMMAPPAPGFWGGP